MANGADGSIIIDTSLDNTGFERNSKKLNSAVQSLTNSVNEMGKDMGKSIESVAPTLRAVGEASQQVTQGMKQASEQAQTFRDDLSGAVSSSAFDKDITAAGRSCTSLAGQLQKIADSARVGFKSDAQILRFQMQVEKARDNVTTMQQSLEALGKQKISFQDYEQLAAATQKAEQALFRLYDRRDVMSEMGVKESSREWQRLDIQIKNAEADLARYEKWMSEMRANGAAYTTGGETAQYQQTAAVLRDMSDQLLKYEQIAAQFNTVSGPASESEQALKNVDKELKQKPVDAGKASSALSVFGNILKGIGSTALKVAGTLARVSFKTLAAGAKAAASAISRFAKNNQMASLTSKGLVKSLTSLRTLLISRLKRTFISMIVKDLRESMNALASYSKSFNAAMSGMKNAMKGLAANLSVSLGGLVQALAPALTTIINWISTAISYLNAFFALLSGKSTVTVAKKQTDDYAKSLGGAAGAAKDLKNQVYGFDELNKKQSESGGGGGGGAGGAGGLFEDVPISGLLPENIAAFFDSIKQAFEAGDWEGIGEIVAGGFNSVISSVDNWINGTLRPEAVKWTSRISRILNGFVAGLDWNALGKTVADGVNAVFDVFNTFLTTFDFETFGKGIGDALNGLFKNIDWALVAQTFANKWNALINGIKGIVQTVDWTAVGSSIATFVNEWFATIDWAGLGVTVSDGIKGILAAINVALEETDWQQIGNDLATFIANIDWSGIVTGLSEGIGAALGGLAATLWGFIEGAWNSVVQWWYDTAYEDGQFTIGGLLNGIWQGICNIGQWIVDNIFTPFINGFKKAFGIASPSTVMEEQGNFIIEGLLNGLKAAWDSITEWFSGILDGLKTLLSDAWESIKTTATEVWNGISSTVSGIWDGLSSAATSVWNAVSSTITGVWDGLSSAATSVWNAVSSTITGVWDGLSGAATRIWNTVSSTISDVWNGLSSTATSVWNAISGTITGVWDGLSSAATRVWNTVSSTVSGVWNSLSSTAVTVWGSIKTTITDAWTNLKTKASEKWESIKTTITDTWTRLKTSASEKWESIKTTITDTWTRLKTSASEKWESIKSTLSEKWEQTKSAASSAWERIKSTVVGLFTGTRDDAKKVDWASVGEGITNGTEGGIVGLWSSFKKRVQDRFASLVSGVKSFLGIHSPSTVFEKIGGYLMSGLKIGIEDGQGTVLHTISNLADSVTDSMAESDPTITLTEASVVTGMSVVADRLSTIADQFTAIAQMLTSIGGFRMPAIAAGTVAPYKTRVDGSDVSTGVAAFSEGITEQMNDQTEVLGSLHDTLRAILDRIERMKLNIDANSIAKSITSLQQSQLRSYGGA